MLELLDVGLEAFLRATCPLSATDVDVSFEPPDRDWSAKLTRATVNTFLWDIRRSASHSRAGLQRHDVNGQQTYQPALPVVELRYVVTAWTSEHADERSLLSGLTHSLLHYGRIPSEFLPESIRHLGEPTLQMARAGEDHVDVFRALEGQLKPGLNVVMITQFEVDSAFPAATPASDIGVALGPRDGAPVLRRRVAGEIANADERGAVGAIARSPGDATIVNPAGQFLLRAGEGDEIVVDTDPPLTTNVPASGGVRFE